MHNVPTYVRKVGDNSLPFTHFPDRGDGSVLDFTGATVRLLMALPETAPKINGVGTATLVNGHWMFSYPPTTQDVDTAGQYRFSWKVTYSNGKQETFPAQGYIHGAIETSLN